MYGYRKNSYPPYGRSSEISRGDRGGGGASTAKICKGKYEAKLVNSKGMRVKIKKKIFYGLGRYNGYFPESHNQLHVLECRSYEVTCVK